MILPMNAKDGHKKAEELLDDPSYIAEVKIDGYRAICSKGRFHSRLGNDLTDKLPHLRALRYTNVILDGELYIPGGNSNDVTTALGKDGDRSKLRYIVFDILYRKGESVINSPWNTRRHFLDVFMFGVRFANVDISKIYTDKRELFQQTISTGDEGIMLKNINGLYVPNKRPENNWYKLKKHMTYDVVIMGYEEGKGKFTGLIGSIIFGLYKDGTLVECGKCSGMTDDVRKDFTMNQQNYIGRVIEIGAMERTKEGNFRHPAFKSLRDDKKASDCTWEG